MVKVANFELEYFYLFKSKFATFTRLMQNIQKYNGFDLLIMGISVLIAFFLPVNQKIVIYLIAALTVVCVISWIKNGVRKLSKEMWPFIILFGFYSIGLIFTTNFEYGFKDIETRLTFLLFPLLFGLTKRSGPINIKPVIYGLVLGCVVAVVLCYFNALVCFVNKGYVECFEGVRLANNIHPTYLALYFISAATFCVISISSGKTSLLTRVYAICLVILFLHMVYRLYSLGPWIGLVGMLVTLLYAFLYFRKRQKLFIIGVVVFMLVAFIAVLKLDFIRSDYQKVSKELSLYFDNPEEYLEANQNDTQSINARIIIWSTSISLIKKHPFGVGTGDGKDKLLSYYESKGMQVYAERKLNPHSQYLQTAISIGIAGMVFLITTFGYYIRMGLKNKNYYLIALVSLFAVACLFESVLERQWGIVFFMFFLSLLLTQSKDDLIPYQEQSTK